MVLVGDGFVAEHESAQAKVTRVDPALSELTRSLQHLRDAVIITEAGEGVVAFWNGAAEDMFGYQAVEAIGLPLERLMPERMRPLHKAGLARYNSSGRGGYIDARTPIQLPAVTKDGVEISIELTLTALNELTLPGRYVLAIARDITERVREEQNLRQSHARLQERLHGGTGAGMGES